MGRLAYRKGDYALIPPYKGEKVNKTGNELGTVEDFALYNLKNDFAQNEDLDVYKRQGFIVCRTNNPSQNA